MDTHRSSTAFKVLKRCWNITCTAIQTSQRATSVEQLLCMLEVKPRNTNCLWRRSAMPWCWSSWIISCAVWIKPLVKCSWNNIRLSVHKHKQWAVKALKIVRSTRLKNNFLAHFLSSWKYCSCLPSYCSCEQNPCCCCYFQCVMVLTHLMRMAAACWWVDSLPVCASNKRQWCFLMFLHRRSTFSKFSIFGSTFASVPFLLCRTVPHPLIFLLWRSENIWGHEQFVSDTFHFSYKLQRCLMCKSCPCALLIKHKATKTYGRVDLQRVSSFLKMVTRYATMSWTVYSISITFYITWARLFGMYCWNLTFPFLWTSQFLHQLPDIS
jgi:hypothetical protein